MGARSLIFSRTTETSKGVTADADLVKSLRQAVRSGIGPFATPDQVVIVPGLPKTRSGKIMRRILRKVACGEEDGIGDISTLADSTIVQKIIDAVKATRK